MPGAFYTPRSVVKTLVEMLETFLRSCRPLRLRFGRHVRGVRQVRREPTAATTRQDLGLRPGVHDATWKSPR